MKKMTLIEMKSIVDLENAQQAQNNNPLYLDGSPEEIEESFKEIEERNRVFLKQNTSPGTSPEFKG